MDQIVNNDLLFRNLLNYGDQNFQFENNSLTNIDHEQDENDQISMPIIYKKRVRTKFTQEQLDVLEATFEQHRYPTIDIIDDLVEQLNLPTQKITIWFQNRRARLKKSQQKLDIPQIIEKDDHQQYDSGIHLDEDISHESPASPPANPLLNILPQPSPSSFMTGPSPYYLPNPHYPIYNPMWSNFGYPFQTPMINPPNNIPYNSSEMSSSFIFQDRSNYSYPKDFNGEL